MEKLISDSYYFVDRKHEKRFLGSLVSGAASFFGQRSANKANRSIAREQMDFQRYMSDTSYQRAVADLKAAGLNPILAAGSGGASSPPGASTNITSETGEAVNSALAAKRLNAEIDLISQQRKESMAREANVDEDTFLKNANRKILQSQIPAATNSAKWHSSRAGKFFDALEKQIDVISPFASSSAKRLEQ